MKTFILSIIVGTYTVIPISISSTKDVKESYTNKVLRNNVLTFDSGPAQSIAHDAGLQLLGRLQTRKSEQIKSSRWGVCGHWIADKHPLSIRQRLDMLSDIGAKWVYLCPDWNSIEPEKNKFDWNSPEQRFDDIVDGLVQRKIKPVIQIYGGNHLYMPLGPDINNRQLADLPMLLDNPEINHAWSRYIEALVKRYKAVVDTWEIWNEPNGPYFWKKEPSASEYGRLVKAAAKIIRSIQPEAVIIAGSTANVDYKYLDDYLTDEGTDSFTYWSIHPYGAVPESTNTSILKMQQLLRSHHKSPAIWQSECGFPSSGNTGGWGYGGPWDETIQAKWILRRLLSDASLDMPVSVYFVLYDYPAVLEGGPDQGKMGVNCKGLYHYGSWQRKKAAYAFANLSSLIDERFQFVTDSLPACFNVTLNDPSQTQKKDVINKCMAKNMAGDQALYLYWMGVSLESKFKMVNADITLPQALTDPVLVDLLDGSVYKLPPPVQSGQFILRNLPIADSPLIICNRNMVKMQP